MKPHPNSKKEEETRFWRFFIGSGAVRQVDFFEEITRNCRLGIFHEEVDLIIQGRT